MNLSRITQIWEQENNKTKEPKQDNQNLGAIKQ